MTKTKDDGMQAYSDDGQNESGMILTRGLGVGTSSRLLSYGYKLGDDGGYSISGKVVKSIAIDGVMNVKVSIGDNYVLTDEDGSYTITGLADGEHTLVLEKDGYTFTPGERTIEIIGEDINDVNFVIRRIYSEGQVWTWGLNNYGQLGDGSTANRSSPVSIIGGLLFNEIAGGSVHSIAVDSNRKAWSWGRNRYGQLGDGTTVDKNSPSEVVGSINFKHIAKTNCWSIIGISEDGDSYGWGYNGYGQLGVGDKNSRSIPVLMIGNIKFIQLSGGHRYSLGIDENGSAYGWGCGDHGRLGTGNTVDVSSPVAVIGGHKFVQISASNGQTDNTCHSLALTADGVAYSWGANNYGQLGDNSTVNKSSPVLVQTSHRFIKVVAGRQYSLGLKSDGRVMAWGRGVDGRLGVGSTVAYSRPVMSCGDLRFIDINTSEDHAISITVDGELYSWGRNNEGQIGDGTKINRSTPVKVNGGFKTSQASMGVAFSIALQDHDPRYNISGNIIINEDGSPVGLSGVKTLAFDESNTTDENGDYLIKDLSFGSYTITPKLHGYEFTPSHQVVEIDGENVEAINFTATKLSTINISGTCKKYNRTDDYDDGKTIAIAINDELQDVTGLTGSSLSGEWSFDIVKPSKDDVITVFMSDVVDASKAGAITKYSGKGNISGVNLAERHLYIGSDDEVVITDSDIKQSYNGYELFNSEIFWGYVDDDFIIPKPGSTSNSDQRLVVKDGCTLKFTEEEKGDVSIRHLEVNGGLNIGSNNLTVTNRSIDFSNGIFSYDKNNPGVVQINGNGSVNTGVNELDNLIVNITNVYDVLNINNSIVINNDLILTGKIPNNGLRLNNNSINVGKNFIMDGGGICSGNGDINVNGDMIWSDGRINGGNINLNGNLIASSECGGRGWIVWNKTTDETWSHSGLLCGLKLNTNRKLTMSSDLNCQGLVLDNNAEVDIKENNLTVTDGNLDFSNGIFSYDKNNPGIVQINKGSVDVRSINTGSNILDNLIFNSTYDRNKFNIDSNIDIVNNLTLTGITTIGVNGLVLSNNSINVGKNFIMDGGGICSGNGDINVNGDMIWSDGRINGGNINLGGDLTTSSIHGGRGWIVWNKTTDETWSHSGLLCGLKLNTNRKLTMSSDLNCQGLVLDNNAEVDIKENNLTVTDGNLDFSNGIFSYDKNNPGIVQINKGSVDVRSINTGSNILDNLIFNSTYDRNKFNIDSNIDIVNNLTLTGITTIGVNGLVLSNNSINVGKNFIMDGGGICSGNGIINVTGDMIWSDGVIYNGNININKNFTRTGGILSGIPTISFSGSGSQEIINNSHSFPNISVSNTSKEGVSFTDSLKVTNRFTALPSANIKFNSGSTYEFTNITIDGESPSTRIKMRSINPHGDPWLLKVTQNNPVASYIMVRNSDASSGNQINATNHGTDFGGNTNWLFGETPYFITGRVTPNNEEMDVENIKISIDENTYAETNKYGRYLILDLGDGEYTVTPEINDYKFIPPHKNETIDGAGLFGIDFLMRLMGEEYFANIIFDGNSSLNFDLVKFLNQWKIEKDINNLFILQNTKEDGWFTKLNITDDINSGWNVVNKTENRFLNKDNITTKDLADILGTLIDVLKKRKIID